MRHGAAGARKRYAGLVETDGGPRVVFTGMEAVRSDWTELAKEVQRELYARLFADQPVEDYLRERRRASCAPAGSTTGSSTARRCASAPEAYTATTPPHVAAARKLGRRDARPHRLRDHDRRARSRPSAAQARSTTSTTSTSRCGAVAEPVLTLLGLDLEEVLGHGEAAAPLLTASGYHRGP